MDCNVNFKGRLIVDGMQKNQARWKNIAKIFKEETKGINYESRIFNTKNGLNICVNRMERKNRNFDYIEDLTTRQANLTKQGTKELLSQSDDTIAKTLAKHLQFVQKLDESCKLADTILNNSYDKVLKIFKKNGFSTGFVLRMFDTVYVEEMGQSKMLSEYKALKELAGFKDAGLSHVGFIA